LISKAWCIFNHSPAFLNYRKVFGPFFHCTKYQSSCAGSDTVSNLRSITKKYMPHPHATLPHILYVLSELTLRKPVLNYLQCFGYKAALIISCCSLQVQRRKSLVH
jgi:hypothetical protein